MVLLFNIVPHRPHYYPGDVLTATAEVCCHLVVPSSPIPLDTPSTSTHQVFNQPSQDHTAIHLVDITLNILGTEQVDPAYINNTFHGDIPAETLRNSRRLVRAIFKTPTAQLLPSCVLQPGERRLFLLRYVLCCEGGCATCVCVCVCNHMGVACCTPPRIGLCCQSTSPLVSRAQASSLSTPFKQRHATYSG